LDQNNEALAGSDGIKEDKMETFLKGGSKNKSTIKNNILMDAIALAKENANKAKENSKPQNVQLKKNDNENINEISVVRRKGNTEELDNYFDEMMNN
jgi:hypothetical protein